MNPEKRGINMGLKNMSDFSMFYKDHAQGDLKHLRNLLFKNSCKLNFSG